MDILQFLNESYTSYHATKNVCDILSANGFVELVLGDKWKISRGGKYFVTRNGSSVVAFTVGKNDIFAICESHTDSPSFKVKGNKLVPSEGAKRLNTEKYGGGILYTYFDRPLKVAGRLLTRSSEGVCQSLVASDYNVVIPSVCIHHNIDVNEKFSVNAQQDTLPLFSQSEKDFYATLTNEEVLDADLFVVPATNAFYAGVDGEFLCSARLDNLTSVYASVQALLQNDGTNICFAVCLDNEEVGSGTRQGNPSFISQILDSLANALGMDLRVRQRAMENGMILSVDNSHACHPAHPEKSDILYKTHLNEGIVIKHHTNYATDGLTSALLKNIFNEASVVYQEVYNRSDMRCGSTLGLATSRELGAKTCDIGLAQLAMHSACETCGANDLEVMTKGLLAFFNAEASKLSAK